MIQSILKSVFFRNVITMLSGNGLALAVTLFSAPVLARVYTPAEYGIVGLFAGTASLFAVVGNWQYSQAVLVEKSDRRALLMFPVCVITSLFTALAACVPTAVLLAGANSAQIASEFQFWFALVPVYAFTTAVILAYVALANRYQKYRVMSSLRLLGAIATAVTSISCGLLGFGAHGLLLGLFADQILTLAAYIFLFRKETDLFRRVRRLTRRRLSILLRFHGRFALFSTPSSFVGNFAMQLPVYLMSYAGQAAWVGLFTRGRQLISMPVTLAANSVAQVYQQRAVAEYTRDHNCWNIFRKTAVMLAAIGAVPTTVCVLAGPEICAFVLGPDWRPAGEIAQVLAPMLLMRFICNPLATTFHVVGAQQDDLRFAILTVTTVLAGIGIAMTNGGGPRSIIVGYSAGYFVAYSLYTLRAGWLAAPRRSFTVPA